MSLTKNYNNSGSTGFKKSFNLTAQVAQTINSINNKNGTWKSRTNKMIKTLTNQPDNPNSNIMTEDDIDKLFDKCKTGTQNALAKTKVSTQMPQYMVQHHKNFVNDVQFLKIEDQFDKFMTGVPEDYMQEDKINQLFVKSQEKNDIKSDLTAQFKKNYLVGKIIGEGAYASVRVAVYKPEDKKIAIKIYEKNKIKDPQRKKSIRRQIVILSLLNHPNIVKILDVVETNNHLNIIMEYLPGTSLGSYLKAHPNGKIPERECKKIFENLVKALRYMHSMKIAHRDIKLENIILDEDLNPKIIDFGFSTCIEACKKIKIFCGTPSYMAPQVVQRKEYRGEAADIWALGVMLYVCLTGIFPFKGATDQELYKKINSSDYPKAELLFSRNISDLIGKMLKIDPEQRITAHEILKHPWLTQGGKKKTDSSLDNQKKRISTQNSNTMKQNKLGNKTGLMKKVLCQTANNENLRLQIKMALQSPKAKQQVQSHRLIEKENTIKYLKTEKVKLQEKREKGQKIVGLGFYKQKQREKQREKQRQKQKINFRMIDFMRMETKRKSAEKSKNRKKI